MFEFTVVVAVVLGLTEAVKRTGYLSSKWSALFAIGVGVALSLFIAEGTTVVRIFEGIISGLTAAGLFSGTKATIK